MIRQLVDKIVVSRGLRGALDRLGGRQSDRLKQWAQRQLSGIAAVHRWIRRQMTIAASLTAVPRFFPALRPGSAPRAAAAGKPLEIVMLVVSNLRFDPRVQREAQALAKGGYRVKIIVPDISSPPLSEAPLNWGQGIEFVPIPYSAADYIYTFPFLFGARMLDYAVAERPFAFHCHDLVTAIIGLAAARQVGARCVCDFHEWWSENVRYDVKTESWIPHPRLERRLFKWAEKTAVVRADAVITVCDSIAKELKKYAATDSVVVHVIRNIPDVKAPPPKNPYPSLRRVLNLEDDQQLVIYQGGVGPSRQLEVAIEALAKAPKTVLAIRGPAIESFSDAYHRQAAVFGVNDRLHCLAPVPSADVVAAAAGSGAVAGLYTVSPICLNWKLALPNKIFEYMAAGLPVLSADYPEVRRLVDRYGIGLVFDPNDPESIGAAFNRMANEPDLPSRFRSRLRDALTDIRAADEWQKVVSLYDDLADAWERKAR